MKKKNFNTITRSSSHSLKFSNIGKLLELSIFLEEYRRVLQLIIDNLWENRIIVDDKILDISSNFLNCPSVLPSDYLHRFSSFFTARMIQCVGKQACSMVRASIKKRSKQLYMLKKLQKEGKNTKYLQRKIDIQPLIKPNALNANAELDSRLVNFKDSKHFDFFCKVITGNRISFNLPILHNKVSRKWLSKGELKTSVRLTNNSLILIFSIPKLEKKKEGRIVGCDQGSTTAATFSDNQVTVKCNHGHDLSSIQEKLARRVKDSIGFKKAQDHRKNYINWSLNQINFSNIKELRLEEIKNIRKGKNTSRKLKHWTYTLIKQKLIRVSEEEGFLFTEVPNEFRSQRCSSCGWVRKVNRKGKTFKCSICGFTIDADLNAASNLELDLFEVPYWVRLKKINHLGFFWTKDGLFSGSWEPIVPDTSKASL
jgi:transposase